MRMRAHAGMAVLVGIVGFSGCSLVVRSADAAPQCRANQQYVKNWGCLSQTVISQAKKNCRFGPAQTSDFTQCLCQDGKQVGACGE